MKKIFSSVWVLILLLLVVINVYLIGQGIKLSNEIIKVEKEIEEFKKENTILEKKLADLDSFEHISSMAAKLNFVVKSAPFSFDFLKQAYKN